MGTAATALRLDDVPPDAYGDAINQACDDVDELCWERYSQPQLQSSDWVSTVAATLAAWYLCTRRGNPPPPGIALREKMAREKLEKVQAHKISIPRLAQLKSFAPVLSIPTVTFRPYPRAVIEKTRGTGQPANYSDAVSRDPFDKLGGNELLEYSI